MEAQKQILKTQNLSQVMFLFLSMVLMFNLMLVPKAGSYYMLRTVWAQGIPVVSGT